MTAVDDFIVSLQQNRVSANPEPMRGDIDLFIAALQQLTGVGGTLSLWWQQPEGAVVAALAQSQGNTIRPQRTVLLSQLYLQATTVGGGTYNVGYAPFNTGTGQMTAAPTYVDTLVLGPVGADAWLMGSFNTPKQLDAGTIYIIFLVRTDGAGNQSTSIHQQAGAISPPGFNPAGLGNGWTTASANPTVANVWVARNNLVNCAFNYTFA